MAEHDGSNHFYAENYSNFKGWLEPTSPAIGKIKTQVVTLPEKLRKLAASIRVQEDLSMELDYLAHVAETLLTPQPSEAHQIDALTERAELAEGLVAQLEEDIRGLWQTVHGYEGSYKTAADRVVLLERELVHRNQDIADLQLTNRNLSRKIAYEIARSNGKA